MTKTTAPGSSSGQFVDDNPGSGVVGTLIVAVDQNAHQDEVYNTINGAGITPSAASNAQLWQAIRKAIDERSRKIGEVFSLLDRRDPVEWSVANADTYFPALCLTDFDIETTVAVANWPLAIDYLRGLKLIFKDGLTGEIASPVVTAWAIAANVGTITFQNDADHIAFLTAIAEDNAKHGSYTNWRTVTLDSAIGDITAGTYAITDINAAARTVSFVFVASNNSGSGTFAAYFYAYRIAGSTTTARIFSAKGLSLMGANDANGYFVSGGLRRRGYFQGHIHVPQLYTNNVGASAATWYFASSAANKSLEPVGTGSGPVTDGTSGTPRTSKENHSPALSVHLYLHLGRYIA